MLLTFSFRFFLMCLLYVEAIHKLVTWVLRRTWFHAINSLQNGILIFIAFHFFKVLVALYYYDFFFCKV